MGSWAFLSHGKLAMEWKCALAKACHGREETRC